MNEKRDKIIIAPAPRNGLLALLATLEPLGPEDDFPEIGGPPPEPVDF
jgi:hypothetical protein